MFQQSPSTSISLPARLLCYLGPPSTILLTTLASPRTGLLSPLAFLPSALFFKNWRDASKSEPSRRAKLEPLIWTFAATGTLGLTAVALGQMVVCGAASRLLFPSSELRKAFWAEFARGTIAGLTEEELTDRAALASSWQNWVFNGVLTFLAAGLIEETLKYLPITYARRQGTPEERKQRDRAYIDYALVGALSFGLVESLGFLYAACETGNERGSRLVLTVFERLVAGSLGHLLAAALTALRATRRDFCGAKLSWWEIVGPSVLLHGTFDFVAMSFSALDGNVGWIHPVGMQSTVTMVGMVAGVIATAGLWVRREWRQVLKSDQKQK